MKKNNFLILILLLFLSCTFITGCQSTANKDELIISAAASMKDSMLAIKTAYEDEHPDITITLNFGSSGSLQHQIEQGSPTDLFISASQSKMQALEDQELLLDSSRKKLLTNELVLIAPKDTTITGNFDTLLIKDFTSFAIGEPASVPAGKYAKEALENLDYYKDLTDKLIFAKDVREVLTWVETGNVDGGIVYATDAKTTDNITVVAHAPIDAYTPIEYPVAIIKTTPHETLAKDFMQYLFSDNGLTIFESYGFQTDLTTYQSTQK